MASLSRAIRRNIVAPVRWLRRREWHRKVSVPRLEAKFDGDGLSLPEHTRLVKMRGWLIAFEERQAAKRAAKARREEAPVP